MPDHPFSVPVNLDQETLNRMTNQLMSEGDANWTSTDFDFLIEQELLRTSLHEYIKRKGLTMVCIVLRYSKNDTGSFGYQSCLYYVGESYLH